MSARMIFAYAMFLVMAGAIVALIVIARKQRREKPAARPEKRRR